MATLVRKASLIGNASALEDLRLVLCEWRASSRVSSQGTVGPSTVPLSSAPAMAHSANGVSTDDDEEDFCRYYEASDRAGQLSAMSTIQKRYYEARMYVCYQHQIDRIAQAKGNAVVSRKAKEEVHLTLFRRVRPHSHLRTTEPNWRSATEWLTFRRRIKHGKRWRQLEEAYTAGIFALLPREVPSTYVERTLTDNLFAHFVRIIAKCCPHVTSMAKSIADTVELAMQLKPPPLYRLGIEEVKPGELQQVNPRDYIRLVEPVNEQNPRIFELAPNHDDGTSPKEDEVTPFELPVPAIHSKVLGEENLLSDPETYRTGHS